MIRKNKAPLFVSVLLILIIAACESARVAPETPRPNPQAPPPAPLILTGYVRDAQTLSGVNGATVKISKADGTVLTTIFANSAGSYTYDVSSVQENVLGVSATKSGYGFSSGTAEINRGFYTASVDDILLTQLQATTATVTSAQGGNIDNTNNQALASQPLNVTIPPNAVSQSVQISVASIPAAQVPAPAASTNQTIVSAGTFEPSGTQFQQAVTITFPLPVRKTPGSTFQVLQLNEATGAYSNSGFTATVDATGTQASADVTHFTIYTLADNKSTLNLPDAAASVVQTTTLTVVSSNTAASALLAKTVSVTLSGGSGEVDADWLRDEISKLISISTGTFTQTIYLSFNITSPESEGGKPSWVQNGIIVGPNPGEAGDASKKAVYNKTSKTRNGTVSGNTGTNQWSRNVQVIEENWVLNASSSGWFWTPHNQGGITQGPF